MKRYIRTKDNLILDITKIVICKEDDNLIYYKEFGIDCCISKQDILIETNNIIDLVQIGDLVQIDYEDDYNEIIKIKNDNDFEWLTYDFEQSSVIGIYVGEDDEYSLVWSRGKGVY